MRTMWGAAAVASVCGLAGADTVSNQQPVSGGGIARWCQLWVDPGPNGNDLDSDSVCWEDFTLAGAATISHLEWWGVGACELGFRVEFWPQDPGTVAYQPLGVFYYGGNHSVLPTARIVVTPDQYTVTPGPGGINHYTWELPNPVALAGNNAANPRWFVSIIGLTHQAYYTWDWSQGTGGSTRTYQWIRGAAPQFRLLSEGRALVIGTTAPPPCYANCDQSTAPPVLNVLDFNCFLNRFAAGESYANCDGSTVPPELNVLDFNCFLNRFALGCP